MIRDFIEICQKKKNVYIQTHDFPDPDAIAASFGLQVLLSQFGVSAKIVYFGRIDRVSTGRMIDAFHIEMEAFDGNYCDGDEVVLVDTQKNSGNVTHNGGNIFACIDHHPTGKPETYEYKQVDLIGSCSSVITECFRALEAEVSADVATALLYGLKMDTMKLSRGVKDVDIDVFSFLLKRSDPEKLRLLETSNLVLDDLRAFGTAIENITVISDIGLSYVPFDCPDALISVLSDFILDLDEISIAIVFSRRVNGVKLSVRSILPYIDAGVLTKAAVEGIGRGGGHPSFAGGFIPADSVKEIDEDNLFSFLIERFMAAYRSVMLNDLGE